MDTLVAVAVAVARSTLLVVRVARAELYFLLIDHMLIRYLFREKSFLSVYLCNLAWWASLTIVIR